MISNFVASYDVPSKISILPVRMAAPNIPVGICLYELTDLENSLAQQALTIYQEAFPLEERDPFDNLADDVSHRLESDRVHHFWVMTNDGVVVALSIFFLFSPDANGFSGVAGHT